LSLLNLGAVSAVSQVLDEELANKWLREICVFVLMRMSSGENSSFAGKWKSQLINCFQKAIALIQVPVHMYQAAQNPKTIRKLIQSFHKYDVVLSSCPV
jgi:hypothetical protein